MTSAVTTHNFNVVKMLMQHLFFIFKPHDGQLAVTYRVKMKVRHIIPHVRKENANNNKTLTKITPLTRLHSSK